MKYLLSTSALMLAFSSAAFAAGPNVALPTTNDIEAVSASLIAEAGTLIQSASFYNGDFLQATRCTSSGPLYTGTGSAMMASVVMARF